MAWNARVLGVALETAGIWLAADPESLRARQVLAALLVDEARLGDAQPHLEKWLAADRENVGQNFLQLNTLLARHPDKAAVLQLTQNLAQPCMTLPEAHYSIAPAAWNADKPACAYRNPRSLTLRPEWEQAAQFQGQLLQRTRTLTRSPTAREYLKSHPRAMDAGHKHYARLLVSGKKYPEARSEFQAR